MALLVLPGGATPAYAVDTDSSGSVTITINQLADANSLKEALAAQGITADVTYPGVGKQCAAGRFTEAPSTGSTPPAGSSSIQASAGTAGFTMTVSKDMIPVSYTHLRAHETVLDLVCRLLLAKKNYTILIYQSS